MTINQNYGGNTSTLFLPAHGGRGYVELGLQSGSLSVAVPEPSTAAARMDRLIRRLMVISSG